MLDPESATSDTDTPDKSTLHDLLSSERRRHVLSCLADTGRMGLPDLADEVAAREHDDPLPQVPEDAVLTVYLSLYHTHIPKLTEAALLRYDQDRDTVALADDADVLDAASPLNRVVGAD